MKASDMIESQGYENVIIFQEPSYDDALIGVDTSNRAVYDFNKMVEWLMKEDNIDETDAIEFIEYNTVRALSYMGENSPIIVYPIEKEDFEDAGDR